MMLALVLMISLCGAATADVGVAVSPPDPCSGCSAEECSVRGNVDVVFVIDYSKSDITQEQVKDFHKQIAGELDLEGGVKVGAVYFRKNANALMWLPGPGGVTAADVCSAMDALPAKKKGDTSTHLGLDITRQMFDQGGRADACKVAVVVTDGGSESKEDTIQAAGALQALGVRMCVVHHGSGTPEQTDNRNAEIQALVGADGEAIRNEADPDDILPLVAATLNCIGFCSTPVDCGYAWVDSGECSESCGDGSQLQQLEINTPAENGGEACPGQAGVTRTVACNNGACPVEPTSCGAIFVTNQRSSGNHEIWRLDIDPDDGSFSETLVVTDDDIEDVEVDPETGIIFYTSNRYDTITRVEVDGTKAQIGPTFGSLSTIGLTLDRVNKRLYFLESPTSGGANIYRMDFDGSNSELAFRADGSFVQDIDFTSAHGGIFWINNNLEVWGSFPDGSGAYVYAIDDADPSPTSGAEGLAFDEEGLEVFWTRDKDPKGIKASIVGEAPGPQRFVVQDDQAWEGIALLGDYVYAAGTSGVVRIPKLGGPGDTVSTGNINKPQGVAAAASPALCPIVAAP